MPCVIRQKEDNIDMKELSKIALAVEPSSTMAIDMTVTSTDVPKYCPSLASTKASA